VHYKKSNQIIYCLDELHFISLSFSPVAE